MREKNATSIEYFKDPRRIVDLLNGMVFRGRQVITEDNLLEKNPDTKIVAVEPKGVSALHGDGPGIHQIQGIGDGFVPDVLDTDMITDVVEVSDEDAIQTARNLARKQGLLVGTSSGANVWAAMQMAEKYGKDKVIATVMADRAERYFSVGLL